MFNPFPPTSSTMQPFIEAQEFKKSGFHLIGEDPFALDDQGKIKNRIQTFFIKHKTYVTVPGIHSTQRELFIDYLNQGREACGLPKLPQRNADFIKDESVAIVIDIDEKDGKPIILIRNDGNEVRAKRAKEVLCEIFPEDQIRII